MLLADKSLNRLWPIPVGVFLLIFVFTVGPGSARNGRQTFPEYELEEVLPEQNAPPSQEPTSEPLANEPPPASAAAPSAPELPAAPAARQAVPGVTGDDSSTSAPVTPAAIGGAAVPSDAANASEAGADSAAARSSVEEERAAMIRERSLEALVRYIEKANELVATEQSLVLITQSLRKDALDHIKFGRKEQGVALIERHIEKLESVQKKAQAMWFSQDLNDVVGFQDQIGMVKSCLTALTESAKFQVIYWNNLADAARERDNSYYKKAEKYVDMISGEENKIQQAKQAIANWMAQHQDVVDRVRGAM